MLGDGLAETALSPAGAVGVISMFKIAAPSGTSALAASKVAEFLKYGRLKEPIAAAYCSAVAVPRSDDSVLGLNPPAMTMLEIVYSAGRC